MASSTKLWAGFQLLTTPSWDPGQLTSARRVTAWDQLPRGDTWHVWDGALPVHPGNKAARTEEVIKMYGPPCHCTRQAPGHLSCSDLGRAQNACPIKSVPLHSTQEPEPEQLRPGKCTKHRVCSGQFPFRGTWSLSSVDHKSTCRDELGQTSVVHTLRTLPTHASEVCLLCSSLPTTQLNKWA